VDRRATLLVAAAVAVLGLAVGLGVAAVDDGGAAPGEGVPDVGVIPGPAACTERPTVAVTVELADGVTEVRVVRPDGRVEVAAGPVAGQPSFSPDGQRLAVLVADGDFSSSSPPSGVATVGLDGAPPTTVTPIDGGDLFPAWSATGTIALLRHDDATRSAWIATVPAEGGEVRRLVEITDPWASVEGLAWAPEGDRLAWLEGVLPSDGSPPTTALRIVDGDGREVRSVALPDPAASSVARHHVAPRCPPAGGRCRHRRRHRARHAPRRRPLVPRRYPRRRRERCQGRRRGPARGHPARPRHHHPRPGPAGRPLPRRQRGIGSRRRPLRLREVATPPDQPRRRARQAPRAPMATPAAAP
jgi:hypothetical protein